MRRIPSGFLLGLLLVSALPAAAQTPRPIWPAEVSAAEGRLTVSWRACPANAREWEAFLSLDGGKTYPIRVTPHLDIRTRSFSWTVPRVFADSARLRLRFGDVGSEREYDVEGGWRIRPAEHASLLLPATRDVGELPARGEEDSAAWVDGSGELPRTVVATASRSFGSAPEWRTVPAAKTALPSRRSVFARPSADPRPRPAPSARLAADRSFDSVPALEILSRLNV